MNDETKTMLAAVGDRTVAALLAAVLDEAAGLRLRLVAVERRMGEVGGMGAPEPRGTPAAAGPDGLALALNGKLAATLVAGGFGSVEAVQAASDEELLAVAGIDAKALKLIRQRIPAQGDLTA